MRTMGFLAFLSGVILFSSSAQAGDPPIGELMPLIEGISVGAGYTHLENRGGGLALDLRGHYLVLFNGAVEYVNWENGNSGSAVRGYLGLGLGDFLQVQGGFGKDGGSVRLRTNLPLGGFINKYREESSDETRHQNSSSLNPIISVLGEFLKGDFRTAIMISWSLL